MHIEILEEAQDDIFRGVLFYESQQYGIGEYFLDGISTDIESLHLYAGIHSVKFGFHALYSKRFPYTIYYKIEDDTIWVYAVLDERQRPDTIKERLNITVQ